MLLAWSFRRNYSVLQYIYSSIIAYHMIISLECKILTPQFYPEGFAQFSVSDP